MKIIRGDIGTLLFVMFACLFLGITTGYPGFLIAFFINLIILIVRIAIVSSKAKEENKMIEKLNNEEKIKIIQGLLVQRVRELQEQGEVTESELQELVPRINIYFPEDQAKLLLYLLKDVKIIK